MTARLIEHLYLLPELRVGRLPVVIAGGVKRLVLFHYPALVVIDLPTAHDHIGRIGRASLTPDDVGQRAGLIRLIGRYHRAAENGISEGYVFGLRAGLQHAAKPIGIFAVFDGFVAFRRRNIGLAVVVDALRRVDEDRLWVLWVKTFAVLERQKVVVHAGYGLFLITFSRLAADETLFQQAQWRESEEIQIIVRIGDLLRFQDAVVIYRLCDELRRIGYANRQQLEIVVDNFRIASQWITARGDQATPLAICAGRLKVVAAPRRLRKEARGVLSLRSASMEDVPCQCGDQAAKFLGVLPRPGRRPAQRQVRRFFRRVEDDIAAPVCVAPHFFSEDKILSADQRSEWADLSEREPLERLPVVVVVTLSKNHQRRAVVLQAAQVLNGKSAVVLQFEGRRTRYAIEKIVIRASWRGVGREHAPGEIGLGRRVVQLSPSAWTRDAGRTKNLSIRVVIPGFGKRELRQRIVATLPLRDALRDEMRKEHCLSIAIGRACLRPQTIGVLSDGVWTVSPFRAVERV